jgi:hypothetical protein
MNIIKYIRHIPTEYDHCLMIATFEKKSFPRVKACWHVAKELGNLLVCAVCGHAIREEYANPENGHTEVYCTRCGWNFSFYI